MLDDFREWLSDNLRYLLLGFAVILLLIIAFFAVRLVIGRGGGSGTETEAVTERSGTEEGSEAETEISLDQDVPEVLETMTAYYTARAEKNVEALREIDPDFSAEDEANLQNNDAVERYDNLTVYSREGLTEGSYLVYVYFDAKLTGIETAAPVLDDVYLETGEDGNLIMVDKYGTQERTEFVEMMRTTDAVQALIQEANEKLAEAEASDADLKAYIDSIQGTGTVDGGDGGTDDTQDAGSGITANSTVTAATTVNVRGEASANGVLYGTLVEGSEATVLEVLDSGWCKIQYTTGGVTIEGYVMTQYLEP